MNGPWSDVDGGRLVKKLFSGIEISADGESIDRGTW
jgi:hypothetical protein